MNRQYPRWAGVLLGAALLAACQEASQHPGNVVYYGATAVYRLPAGAHIEQPSKSTAAFYTQRFNFYPRFNLPLHRIVVGGGPQTVYLGLAVAPVPNDLRMLVAADSAWQLVARRALPGQAQLGLLRSHRGEFDVRYVGRAKVGSTHVINVLTRDSVVAYSYYLNSRPLKGSVLL